MTFWPFCWYHGLLSLLRFHSIIKWLPVTHIWHEMSNHKSLYLSQANCSKIILLLQTTEEKNKKTKVFPDWMLQSRSAWAVSGVTLYNYTGFCCSTLCIYMILHWQESAEMHVSLGYCLFTGLLALLKPLSTWALIIILSKSKNCKVKNVYYCCNHKDISDSE